MGKKKTAGKVTPESIRECSPQMLTEFENCLVRSGSYIFKNCDPSEYMRFYAPGGMGFVYWKHGIITRANQYAEDTFTSFLKKETWTIFGADERVKSKLAIPRKRMINELAERDGWECIYCGKTLDENTVTLEHILPVKAGGNSLIYNLALCCRPCNQLVGAWPVKTKILFALQQLSKTEQARQMMSVTGTRKKAKKEKPAMESHSDAVPEKKSVPESKPKEGRQGLDLMSVMSSCMGIDEATSMGITLARMMYKQHQDGNLISMLAKYRIALRFTENETPFRRRREQEGWEISLPLTLTSSQNNYPLACELGHILMGHCPEMKEVHEGGILSIRDSAANAFAMELLMPEDEFRAEAVAGMQLSDLAKRFLVTEAVIRQRLGSLGLNPSSAEVRENDKMEAVANSVTETEKITGAGSVVDDASRKLKAQVTDFPDSMSAGSDIQVQPDTSAPAGNTEADVEVAPAIPDNLADSQLMKDKGPESYIEGYIDFYNQAYAQ